MYETKTELFGQEDKKDVWRRRGFQNQLSCTAAAASCCGTRTPSAGPFKPGHSRVQQDTPDTSELVSVRPKARRFKTLWTRVLIKTLTTETKCPRETFDQTLAGDVFMSRMDSDLALRHSGSFGLSGSLRLLVCCESLQLF